MSDAARPLPPLPTLVLLGGPGTGKTTLATAAALRLGGQAWSTGDLIRKAGRLPRGRGGLADTGATVALLRGALAVQTEGWRVLDGFPRSAHQVPAALELLHDVRLWIWLELDPETALARMRTRARPGEDPPRQAQRLAEAAWRSAELRAALTSHRIALHVIDASATPDLLAQQLLELAHAS